jgi:hypothetical protein
MAEAKKKRKPRKIITTRHDDNTYSHEHMHDGGDHNLFAGTSQDISDVQQHVADHFGGGAEPDAAAQPAAGPDAPTPGE